MRCGGFAVIARGSQGSHGRLSTVNDTPQEFGPDFQPPGGQTPAHGEPHPSQAVPPPHAPPQPPPYAPSQPPPLPGPAGVYPPAGGPATSRRKLPVWAVVLLSVGGVLVAGFVAVELLMGFVFMALGGGGPAPSVRPTQAAPSESSAPANGRDLVEEWTLDLKTLRPDVSTSDFVHHIDGTFADAIGAESGKTWLLITESGEWKDMVIHGVDSGTGAEIWRVDAGQAMCASEPLNDAFICARAVGTDPKTQLGVAWEVMRLDPSTGEIASSIRVEAWATALAVGGGEVLLVEQPQGDQHVVLHGFSADLMPTWSVDFAEYRGHQGMFNSEQVILAHPMPGLPLAPDRLVFFDVSDDIVGFKAGNQAVLLNVETQRGGMRTCGRPVVTEDRLWCNEYDEASQPTVVIYDHALTEVARTAPGLQLLGQPHTLHQTDARAPVVMDQLPDLVRIDPATGENLGQYSEGMNGEAFGMNIEPLAKTGGGFTVVKDALGLTGVDPLTGEVLFKVAHTSTIDVVMAAGDNVMIVASRERITVNPASGEVVSIVSGYLGGFVTPLGHGFVVDDYDSTLMRVVLG